MPSAMHLIKKMEINSGLKGVLGLALDTGIGFGTSYGIGQIYQRYGSDHFVGKHVARITAGVGKAAAVITSLATGGRAGLLVGGFDAMGQAGVDAIGLEMGLRHARKASGKKAVLVPIAADVKGIPGASEMTSIGALGKAAPGRGMNWDQIEEMAAGR